MNYCLIISLMKIIVNLTKRIIKISSKYEDLNTLYGDLNSRYETYKNQNSFLNKKYIKKAVECSNCQDKLKYYKHRFDKIKNKYSNALQRENELISIIERSNPKNMISEPTKSELCYEISELKLSLLLVQKENERMKDLLRKQTHIL